MVLTTYTQQYIDVFFQQRRTSLCFHSSGINASSKFLLSFISYFSPVYSWLSTCLFLALDPVVKLVPLYISKPVQTIVSFYRKTFPFEAGF